MKKILTVLLTLLMVLSSVGMVFAEGEDTKSTSVTYQVGEYYEWVQPADVAFTNNAYQNVERSVAVTKNTIEANNKLNIKILGDANNEFKIKAEEGDTTLAYAVSKSIDGTALTTGTSVLEVASGINTISQNLYFTLTKNGSEAAGNYSGICTFEAEIVPVA